VVDKNHDLCLPQLEKLPQQLAAEPPLRVPRIEAAVLGCGKNFGASFCILSRSPNGQGNRRGVAASGLIVGLVNAD